MFTGIVTDIGTIENITGLNQGIRLRITTSYAPTTIALGASIACAGVCLTVVKVSDEKTKPSWFEVEAWEEALQKTTIKQWRVGQTINLERPLRLGDEVGGHLVSGHVDATAKIVAIEEEGDAKRFYLKIPEEFLYFIINKGSVALDGTSLTVNSVKGSVFDVLIIRHSLAVTTWHNYQVGDEINIEIDQMARYAARLKTAP